MNKKLSCPLHDDDKTLQAILKKDGMKGVHTFIKGRMPLFKIAVTGQTGTGKSSFVNSIRGVRDDDVEAAPVGIVETTKSVQAYKHPLNENLLIYDLPGIGGSSRFSREKYFDDHEVKFSSYDFYVIVSSSRFTELDVFLARKVNEIGKKFYFVRSKIDLDLMNMKTSDPKGFDRQSVLETIQKDCIKQLNCLEMSVTVTNVFLLNNFKGNEYDFPRLRENIVHDAPFMKIDMRENMLSLAVYNFYEQMKQLGKKRASTLALKSAIEGKTKIPQTTVSVEIKSLTAEVEDLKQIFSLQDKDISDYAEILNTSVKEMSNNFGLRFLEMDFTEIGIISACAELYNKVSVDWPLIGAFVSSRSTVKAYLEKVVDIMTDDALKINLALISKRRNEYSQFRSTEL